MTKNQIIRCAAFSVIVCLLLVLMCELFENTNTSNYATRMYSYRNFNEDTVDAVMIGTSGIDRYWIAAKAYEDYGMTVYPLAIDSLPAWLYVDMVDYALKYQNPELIILDPRAFCQDNEAERMDVRSRRVLDSMPRFSAQWFRTAFKSMEMIHAVDSSRPKFDISFLLSFIRFHPAWQDAELTYLWKHIGNRQHKYGGFYMDSTLTTVVEVQAPYVYDAEGRAALNEMSEQALYDVVEHIRSKGVQVLVLDTPQFPKELEMKRLNTVRDKMEEMGVPFVSYYRPGEDGPFTLDLDPETDFYNAGHVNYYGAEKFTEVFAAYLDANYDLPDRRNDPQAQAHWDGVYDKIGLQIQEFISPSKKYERSLRGAWERLMDELAGE